VARIIAYVDGFNTYYGLFKEKNDRPPQFSAKYKWLNWVALVQKLFPTDEVVGLRYFTAIVHSTRKDRGQPARQAVYLEALQSLPNVRVKLGTYTERRDDMLHFITMEKTPILRTEEKGSDVNLATFLIADAFNKQFEKAVVVSNDSDLKTPVNLVKSMKLQIQVVNPSQDKDVLKPEPTKPNPRILESDLAASQFPSPITLKSGTVIERPPSWS
jgi:uncharacterized LabA/DUF88 family protein